MKTLSGIYEIKCIETNKVYIGSSQNIYKRWQVHRNNLKNNNHPNRYLQAVWNIYGENSFTFRVLEECEKDILLVREDHHIQNNNSYSTENGYNLSRKAGSPMAGLNHTEQTKSRMSKVQTGRKHSEETKTKIGRAGKGKKATPEQIEKNRLGHLGIKPSEETRNKLSAIHTNPSPELRYKMGSATRGKKIDPEISEKGASKRRKTYQFVSPAGEVITIVGIGKFCRENNLDQGTMSNLYAGKKKSHKGWTRVKE